jgi:hypothetical protein
MAQALGLAGYPLPTAAVLAADGLDYLLSIVAKRAEEHPSLKTIEAASALLVAFLITCSDWLPARG